MEIGIRHIPHEAGRWDVVRTVASVLHSPEFRTPGARKDNFKIELSKSNVSDVRNGGTGTLKLANVALGTKFLRWTYENPVRIKDPASGQHKKIKFFKKSEDGTKRLPRDVIETLAKTPFAEPDVEEEHQQILAALTDQFRVDSIQFGVFYRDRYPMNDKEPLAPRSFSIEYKQDLLDDNVGWLKFEYDHKLMRITVCNPVTGSLGYSIAINLSAIQRIGVGYDGKPYVCFDTLTPPILETFEYHRSQTGDKGEQKYKQRVGALDDAHRAVAPYAPHLRILLYKESDGSTIDKFVKMCKGCNISEGIIIRCDNPGVPQIEASGRNFFARKVLYRLQRDFRTFPWRVAFQLEALLHSSLLHTEDIIALLPRIRKMCKEYPKNDSAYVDDFLRRYAEGLRDRVPRESPMKCFDRISKEYIPPKHVYSTFLCRHVTFTPTRLLMEGPYATQSNRIVRQYSGFDSFFIRVDFRDEDRLQYRWDRAVDGASFVRERVGTILKDGFEIAGRQFEFLAYSNSALKEHAVWFMCPFQHDDPKIGWVNSTKIRGSIGNFKGELLKMPSKYAARLAQAFTATEASVSITRTEWEEVEDLVPPPSEEGLNQNPFTDGLGSISRSLGDKIWKELCKNRGDHGERSIKPSAYQIRFLGCKGVVAVDEQLDKTGNGIHMRVRKSMWKFDSDDDVAPIEIAQAFEHPNACYLNRPLVMLLEDLGVRKDAFLALQDTRVAGARTIHDNIAQFRVVLSEHGLGRPFKMTYFIKRLQDLGLEINGKNPGKMNMDTPFLKQVRQVAMMDIMRDIKHNARILMPNSYLLVGVADEGPAYEKAGFENVYSLPMGCVYACIQEAWNSEPFWLEGHCAVTRSPVAYIGDIQRVRAIGKPPEGMLCLFAHMKNVLVMASKGKRSLASCLGGGDVDGDLFQIIQYEPLLPKTYEEPADYESLGTKTLDRDSTVEDICDFIVEYINSDVLGLVSDRLLMIADQSLEGMNDGDCRFLARLCSQAVDYPKNGIPVDLSKDRLPNTLIRCKPDWHAAETISPRHTDYYESTRALGVLYRAITLTEPESIEQSGPPREPLRDPVSQLLREKVEFYIGDLVLPTRAADPQLESLYRNYMDEINYICSTHSLSNTPGAKLREAEVVAGTILAKCSQKRWRNNRVYRMRLHTTALVMEIKTELLEQKERSQYSIEELTAGLERAWRAWEYSQTRPFNETGSNSFGFIALDVIFDALEQLEYRSQTQVTTDSDTNE